MLVLDRARNDTSVCLDLLRAIAAQMVCVGHAIVFFIPHVQPVWLPYLQAVGVLIFFLLSGLLITATLWKRSADKDYGFLQFFIDRFARIYSGLVPALALVLILDGLTLSLTGEPTIARYYTWQTLVANLAMMENYRGAFYSLDMTQWSAFGSASPLWTLAIEWHIYLFVSAVFFVVLRRGLWPLLLPLIVLFGQMPSHYLFGALSVQGNGRGLFGLWIVGSACYFFLRPIPPRLGTVIFIFACTAYLTVTKPQHEYDLITYAPLVIGFAAIIATTQSTKVLRSTAPPISFFADYSFSLYLVHHTVMYDLYVLRWLEGWTAFLISLTVANLFAIGISYAGERHHKRLARWLAGLIWHHAEAQPDQSRP